MNFRDKQATNYLNPSVIQLPKFVTFYVTNFGTITLVLGLTAFPLAFARAPALAQARGGPGAFPLLAARDRDRVGSAHQ